MAAGNEAWEANPTNGKFEFLNVKTMIISIDSLEEYTEFISAVSKDSSLSDPHFVYDQGNLYDAFKKKNQIVFVSKQGDTVTGIFVWMVLEEDRYAEMIIGLVQTKAAMHEMLDYMEEHYSGYQADFVINPQNSIIRGVLNEKKAAFDTEQQRMFHHGKNSYTCNRCVEEFSPRWKEEYCSMHITDTYWTAEKVLSRPDRFRVLVAIEDEEFVGYLDVTRCFEMNEPYALYVKPEKENMGYEKALLESALAYNVPKTMMVMVDVDNLGEIQLFKSVGFETLKGQNNITATYTL